MARIILENKAKIDIDVGYLEDDLSYANLPDGSILLHCMTVYCLKMIKLYVLHRNLYILILSSVRYVVVQTQ